MKKHHDSIAHKKAVVRMFGDVLSVDEDARFPCLGEFDEAWRRASTGVSPSTTSSRKLEAKLRYCVSEAIGDLNRENLSSTAAISLKRDERASRLAVRFASTSNTLVTTHGYLGALRTRGDASSIAISDHTATLIKRICTPRYLPPFSTRESITDEQLHNKIRESIVEVSTDAATNERTAALIMQQGINDHRAAYAPNLRFVSGVNAHAARRMALRPTKADAYLDWAQNTFLFGRGSITAMIEKSDEFKSVFGEHVRNLESSPIGTSIHSIRRAKHRFESSHRPSAMCVLLLPAFINTGETIRTLRPSSKDQQLVDHFSMPWTLKRSCKLLF